GTDLAVTVRFTDDGWEEVDRLNQRRSALPSVHTRIVRGPEVDQNSVVSLGGDGAQHLSELACGEFARSTGAGDHLCETFHHSLLCGGALRSARQPIPRATADTP